MIPESETGARLARCPVLAGALGLVVIGVLRGVGVRRLVVEGRSMAPTLLPGDRVLVLRSRRLKVGDLVAVPDPRGERRLLIKRITAIHGGLLELRGDNPDASTDSRDFGDVPTRRVLGRVVRRYAPSRRRGAVR
jgi:nickel-type superoxide dismutase maturation protease